MKKTKFDISKYTGVKVVMHCPTKDSAEEFLNHLQSIGRIWCDGIPYDGRETMWDTYKEYSCYVFNEGMFGELDDYKRRNYLVLNFYDFIMPESVAYSVEQELDNFIKEFSVK